MAALAAVAVCGPTASGKSELAARAALEVGGEIVNADSRQVYEGMRIGTGWPSEQIMAMVPHHGYGIAPPSEQYNAGRFVMDASRTVADIISRSKVPILVGGTGLYVEALGGTMPLDRAVAAERVKMRVRAESEAHPQEALYGWLAVLSRESAARVPPNDAYRTLRALESALALRTGQVNSERTGQVNSERTGQVNSERSVVGPAYAGPTTTSTAPVRLAAIILQLPRDELRERIRRRMAAMFESGLLDEAVEVRARYRASPALTGLGYAEALALFDGLATADEALRLAAHRTCLYAKRQETWFRRMRGARVVDARDARSVVGAIADAAREISALT